jgi:hypothetical protein
VIGVSMLVAACYEGVQGREDSITSFGSNDAGEAGSNPTADDAATSIGEDTEGAEDTEDTSPADGSTTAGEPATACTPDEVAANGSSLAFDGIDDHVTMGAAPELGLTTFTVEAWVRRDGAGEEASTGVGGVRLVPIAGKGRGETDDTIYNCNYAFGLHGGVLAADFEDTDSGANHPIIGTVAIPWGEWHHVATTFDGSFSRLYVDGKLDVEVQVNATPRSDSIQHFAIGTAMDSMGVPGGFFAGAIDEVRVWNHARSEAEIAESMKTTVLAGEGLVARWALDEADGGVPDSVGNADGVVTGPTFASEGAVLDQGQPPSVLVVAPAEGEPMAADSVELEIVVDDTEQQEFVASFHLREVTSEDDFTIVVLPDTQYYSDEDSPHGGSADSFHDQTQWVRDNREAYNILGVIHNGDIVNHGSAPEEWVIANAAMARLETPEPALPEGMPYGVCIGNHDQDSTGTDGATTAFNQHFGIERFAGRSYYGGHYGANNDQNWVSFHAGNLEFVVVNLEFDTTPDPAVIAWARTIFEAHPDAFGVLNTHYLINGAAEFGPQGQAIYDGLRSTDNVHLMTCGHISNESQRSDVFEGHTIHTMLADYQNEAEGGAGFLRIWEFSPANDELTVRSYSPSKDIWLTDENSEFTLEVELPGAGGPFLPVAIVDPAPSVIGTGVDGLLPGRTYEWYATIDDCAHTVTTPVQRFTTLP